MKVMRKIIEVDEDKCTGCGLCVTDCAEGALEIIDGKARVVNEVFCDGLGACIGACPEDALTIVEREAPEFDEEAVDRHLQKLGRPTLSPQPTPARHGPGHGIGHGGGCPGSAMRMFDAAPKPAVAEDASAPSSALAQWPIQLRLLPPFGPLWQDKEVVLLADCVAAAYPDLHRKLIQGKTIVMTCPKLDDAQESINKLAQVFQNPLKSITVAIMEVPCCGGLVRIAQEALRLSGADHTLDVTTISVRGEVL
jgi:NAD-dependent dihydropyrimidine dehydrogenase PreA subunit